MKTERRILFTEFKDALDARDSKPVDLSDYVEMDPDSPRPRLRFRADALLDDMPADFDVDRYIYEYLQEIDDARYEAEALIAPLGRKKILGEGDSWMNLPAILFWKAIGDSIWSRRNFRLRNIGYWGHTLKGMLDEKQYMTKIASYRPDYFVFSGGGNDLQDQLAAGCVVKPYDSALDPTEYLTTDGENLLVEIGENYEKLLTEVTAEYPALKIFTHSYDCPRPLLGKGKYLGRHLRDRDIPDNLMSPIMDYVLLRLDATIHRAADSFGNVTHVNNFGVTKNFLWRDDFHPKNAGFDALAKAIEVAINRS